MANLRPEAAPNLEQVREYVLAMLEGLSNLADMAEDEPTRDRLRDLAHHFVARWASESPEPLRPDFGRLGERAARRNNAG